MTTGINKGTSDTLEVAEYKYLREDCLKQQDITFKINQLYFIILGAILFYGLINNDYSANAKRKADTITVVTNAVLPKTPIFTASTTPSESKNLRNNYPQQGHDRSRIAEFFTNPASPIFLSVVLTFFFAMTLSNYVIHHARLCASIAVRYAPDINSIGVLDRPTDTTIFNLAIFLLQAVMPYVHFIFVDILCIYLLYPSGFFALALLIVIAQFFFTVVLHSPHWVMIRFKRRLLANRMKECLERLETSAKRLEEWFKESRNR